MFPNKAPASATPTGGGGWSGWSPSTSSSRPATLGYPAVNTPFKGPVPQVPISRPTAKPPTSATPKPPSTTPTAPRVSNPAAGIVGGGVATGVLSGIPKLFKGDVPGAITDGVIGGGAYVAGAALVTAGLGAAGVTSPVWVPVAAAIGGGVAAYTALTAANGGFGDGTEGAGAVIAPQVPSVPGQTGQVPGARYYVWSSATQGSTTYENSHALRYGPVSYTYVGKWSSKFWFDVHHRDGVSRESNPNAHDSTWSFGGVRFQRYDGTSVEDDIAADPNAVPGAPTTIVTNTTINIQNGDTVINISPPVTNTKTPVVPPPPSPTPAPGQTPGKPGQIPPVPPPITATPSAPTTTAGTPTSATPETGPPAPSTPAAPSRPAPTSITGTPATGGTKPATTSPKSVPNTPTPTGTPITVPRNTSDTNPAASPVTSTEPNTVPARKQYVYNEAGELIGRNILIQNDAGEWVVSSSETVSDITGTTVNTVDQQRETTRETNDAAITELVVPIVNPTPPPTGDTTVPTPDTNTTITETVNNAVNNSTTTITETVNNTVNNSTNTINETVTNTVNNYSTTIIEEISGIELGTDLIKADTVETLAIVGTLATAAALNAQTTTITNAIANQPSPCTYPSYHPENVAERAAISGKVDGVNTVLGTVTNVQIAQANTGISSIITAIGTPIAGGAQTLFAGIQAIQTWGTNFAKSIHLDRAINALSFMLQVHNAAMLSRNLAESVGQLIDSTLTALRLKDEDDEFLDIPTMIGNSVQGLLTSILGADTYQGINRQWKLLSAIYTSAMNIYGAMLSSLSGIAEGVQVAGNYTGRIGNALKRGGVVLENAYNWMDDNLRIKMGKVAWLDSFANNLESVTDAVEDITQVPEEVISVGDNYKDAKEQLQEVKQLIADNVAAKTDAENTDKTNSDPGTIADGSVPPFTL
jgi:hypothetical protein